MSDYEYRSVVYTTGESDTSGTLTGEQRWTKGQAGWHGFKGRVDLTWIHDALDTDAAEDLWDMQDGYGVPGYNAGDWSGIRDSSESCIAAMWAVARDAVPAAEFFERRGLPVPHAYSSLTKESA